MDRLTFLTKARQCASQQVSDSSALTDAEFKAIMESDDTEEVALYRMAQQILEDASHDAQNTLVEVIEYEKH